MKPHSYLIGCRTGRTFPLETLDEFGPDEEMLEVALPPHWPRGRKPGNTIYERFREFWPFRVAPDTVSFGEAHTPLLKAPTLLKQYTGLDRLYLKNETSNPTLSFKDRGTMAYCALAREIGETYLATISTGNMAHSTAAYAARCGLRALIIVPASAVPEKLLPAALHGAGILRVSTKDLGDLKERVRALAQQLNLRISSGASPYRVEGYKFSSFELWEQMEGVVPEFVAVPTSAGGHIRGLFKGWLELHECHLIEALPRMILVQPSSNAPLAEALKHRSPEPIPFPPAQTFATALTSNHPPGGRDLLEVALRHEWVPATVTEEEIVEGWQVAARSGLWLEPSSALVFPALRKLVQRKRLARDATVVAVLTGAGIKDTKLAEQCSGCIHDIAPEQLEETLNSILGWV